MNVLLFYVKRSSAEFSSCMMQESSSVTILVSGKVHPFFSFLTIVPESDSGFFFALLDQKILERIIRAAITARTIAMIFLSLCPCLNSE